MNLQNETKGISFNDCQTLQEIKERMMASKTMPSRLTFGMQPAWYVYGFNSLAQMDRFLKNRMILMTINRQDISSMNLQIRSRRMGEG